MCDAYVLQLLRFVTSTLCAATFSNSYVKWRLCYVMLPYFYLNLGQYILWERKPDVPS